MTDSTEVLVPVIGLEIHAQLLTESKMFCGCSAHYSGAPPNTHCCAVCTGMPGALPVINSTALQYGLMSALALGCSIAEESKFDRKNYSYPDLPKGYQISQYDEPIARDGSLEFRLGEETLRWGITRVHLEEDTGKTLHMAVDGTEASLVDYNRSGVPLMEIVTTPESHTPRAAREFFSSLRQLLVYLGVSDGNLQEGSLRVDANISLRTPEGALGTKSEIKNLNSFRALERSLQYEIERQSAIIRAGDSVEQETRGWSERDEVTVSQRSKEYAHDYRYFPEPDLPPLKISRERLHVLQETLPELPSSRRARFERDYRLALEVAEVLTQERALADYFERVVRASANIEPAVPANWIKNELLKLLGESDTDVVDIPVPADRLAALISFVESGEISNSAGKRVLDEIFRTGEAPDAVVDRLDLRQVRDESELERLVDQILASQPKLVETYRSGKTNVLQALVGQVLKASGGKANPKVIPEILRERLDRS